MRAVIAALPFVMLTGAVAGAVEDYDDCVAMIAADPAAAEQAAGNWARFGGGGAAARHCYALALVAIGAPLRAADELLGIAAEEPALEDPARADILVQAGDLLVEAGDTVTAAIVAENAVRLTPKGAAALGLRASVRLAGRAFEAALSDLDTALVTAPEAPRLLMLRASAYRQTGRLIAARDDASFATELAPDDPRAWLERGRIEARMSDRHRARRSLLRAIDLDRDGGTDTLGKVGTTARNVLQRMEAGLALE